MAIFGLVGMSGFGREVMPIFKKNCNNNNVSDECIFVDVELPATPIADENVVLETEFLSIQSQERFFNVAIADCKLREKIVNKFLLNGCKPKAIISETTIIQDRVTIGDGAILCNFTHLLSDTKIGRFFHCNFYSYVAHDCIIGDYVTFAPKVCCNGNVHINDYAYVGTGAVIKQGTPEKPLVIGEGAIIGMGAVVTKDVAPYEVVVGNPAKPLEK